MRVSILNLHCLNAISDDYETAASIVEDVRRSSHGNVDAAEIAVCLVDLVRDDMVKAFRFDPLTGSYQAVETLPPDIGDLWFHITVQGRRQLDADWVDD